MKSTMSLKLIALAAALFACGGTTAIAFPAHVKRANPQGVDISHYQGTVDFDTLVSNGLSFVYIKATEGTCQYFSLSPPILS